MNESAAPRSLAELADRQLGGGSAALTVRSARELKQADIEDLVQRDAEDRDLLGGGGPALEVVFSIAGESGRWIWRFRLHQDDDVPLGERGEYLAEEVSWRLIEWLHTREQQRPAAAPRLLRAS
jgi:hypothetical protein